MNELVYAGKVALTVLMLGVAAASISGAGVLLWRARNPNHPFWQ